MDPFNLFIDGSSPEPISGKVFHASKGQIVHCLKCALSGMSPELIVINTPLETKEIMVIFPEVLGIKCVKFEGNRIQNFVRFCEEFPSEWEMLAYPRHRILASPHELYKRYWKGSPDQVFLPAASGGFDFSGHLLFMNYYSYRRLDANLTLTENLYELSRQGISFVGVQGVTSYEQRVKNNRSRYQGPDAKANAGTLERSSEPPATTTGPDDRISTS